MGAGNWFKVFLGDRQGIDLMGACHYPINITAGYVLIGPEHHGRCGPPHDLLDDRLRDLLLDHVINPGVAEQVRCDMPLNACPLCNDVEHF